MKLVCDHYLDLGLGLRETRDRVVIWPCPSCGKASFVASFDEGAAGCAEQDCETPRAMGLSELVAYLDQDVPVGDVRRANERFAEIFEAAVGREREREDRLRERNRRARGGRRGSPADEGNEERGFSEPPLF